MVINKGARGEEFCSSMIRSQCFRESVALDYDLHKCFSAFSNIKQWLGWTGFGFSPFPTWKARRAQS